MKSRFRAYLERQQPVPVDEILKVDNDRANIFVAIPCFDEPDLLRSLSAIAACKPPLSHVTVIVVVNSSDQSPPEILTRNLQTLEQVQNWWKINPRPFYRLKLLHAPLLPSKWAGVGWARKIAMDEAIRSLEAVGKEEGILIAFDADSIVSTNYLVAIEETFKLNPGYNFVTLNFCHPVDDPGLTPILKEGIILYELYLRYLREALQWAGYPHAIHTIGSSFAVKASAYVKQGGMNRRQAGEDFHFLHKIVPLGDYGCITEATVFPACRVSHRVPFGTGAALKKWEEGDQELYSAYSLKSFRTLLPLLADPGYFFLTDRTEWEFHIHPYDKQLQEYLLGSGILNQLEELKHNCANVKIYKKRFYHLVNAFFIIQYLNSCETAPGGKGELKEEASRLLNELQEVTSPNTTTRELLEIFRRRDGLKG